MKNKLLPVTMVLIICAAVIACVVLSLQNPPPNDTVKLNELKASVESNIQDYSKIDCGGYDITVIDFDGAVKFSTGETTSKSYDEWLNYAYRNDCVLLEFSEGRILVFKTESYVKQAVILTVAIFSATLILLLTIYYLYIRKSVFEPFKKLKLFAGEVSSGNLDSPLLMDKNNAFGAFTESFDIMREELKAARSREIALEKSKKELVAQLSHDIKTPVASIKAVAEVLQIGETDDKKLRNIGIIRKKASEVDSLITDIFNATLQELSELKVDISTVSSADLARAIVQTDYLGKVKDFSLPDCLIEADGIRLAQIFGNILNNSYKYAETEIEVASKITDGILEIEFKDFGDGVTDEELPLITNKFYRGCNAVNKNGAGLGLYICRTIIEKMGGGIECCNTENGFSVKIFLKLT